jgi:GTPase
MFVDKVTLKLKAGDGGDGRLSFVHEKSRPNGGPDGGDGGSGGGIVLKASRNENTLANFRYKKVLKAQDGLPGTAMNRHGKNADNLIVKVPVGTSVISGDEVLVDLTVDEQEAVIAKGGSGGYGNAHFTSSTRQAPRISEKGEKGEELEVTLELKLIADIGIIGLPNAGKSTLLSVISNAKPEIANYPFTTLHPNLGVVDIGKGTLLFADIPGLIEGASQGKGLGDEFLRHVERTNVLLHLIDVYNDNVVAAYKTVIKELKDYKMDLSSKPQIIALTKVEGFDEKKLGRARKSLEKVVPKNTPVLEVSSLSRDGLLALLRAVQKKSNIEKRRLAKKAEKTELPIIKFAPDENDWQVDKSDKQFVVTGIKIERFASRTRFEDFHGEQRFRDIMRKMGITAELERQGIDSEQTVQIGEPAVAKFKY